MVKDEKKQELQNSGLIEWPVFSELVAMDEDEEGFSQSLFQTFVDQVLDTFKEIEDNLKQKNFDKVSSLGHYLKGSAAALGLVKISSQCERIQNYGHKVNFDNYVLDLGEKTPKKDTDEYWVEFINDALVKAKDGFNRSRKALNEYFEHDF